MTSTVSAIENLRAKIGDAYDRGDRSLIHLDEWCNILDAALSAEQTQQGVGVICEEDRRMLADMAEWLTYPGTNGARLRVSRRHVKRLIELVRSALVDVPAEPVQDDIVGYVMRYGGMCRDCADMDGVCQSGMPCDIDQRRAMIMHTIAALTYGIKHRFIASPFDSSPPSRGEGEDSAEVYRQALERIANASARGWNVETATEALNTARAIAATALAATRSGSATTSSGTVTARRNALDKERG